MVTDGQQARIVQRLNQLRTDVAMREQDVKSFTQLVKKNKKEIEEIEFEIHLLEGVFLDDTV